MEVKEAIAELRNMHKFNYTLAPNEVFTMAISALEKQDGKKPDCDCPCCHSDRIEVWQDGGYSPTRFEYCPDCGQKIDWSDMTEVNDNG